MKKLVPLAGIVGYLVFGDWIAALSFAVLALCWILLPAEEGPPVLALAVTNQWVAVTIGLFYVNLTGRQLDATIRSDYQTMVLLGLGCVTAMAIGLWAGNYLIGRLKPPTGLRPKNALSFKTLVLVYVIGTASLGFVVQMAWQYQGLMQAIVALTYVRLGLLYLIFRRMVARGEWHYVGGLLVVEVILGITGFYAGFREPLIMAVLAFLEHFNTRSVRQWAVVSALGIVMVTLGIVWIGVRSEYRGKFLEDTRFSDDRSARIELLSASIGAWAVQSTQDRWDNIDRFVDRMWTVYYPALVLDRVPKVIPHTDGALMSETLQFTFEPRLFFPNKPEIKSDSEMVRKYSGVAVAGEEANTDIAFGYAAESYVDFGVPMMFVPSLIWGLFIGVVCALIFHQYRHRDLAVSMVVVIGWMSLYLFERSWVKTIGLGGTLLIYAGGLAYILDRLWFEKSRNVYIIRGVDEDGVPIEGALDAALEADIAPALQLRPHSK